MPAPPTVRLLHPGEAAVLSNTAADVFDKPIRQDWARAMLAAPGHVLAVALAGDTVVGMASALVYLRPDKPPEMWISEVGVAPAWHRQGLGRRLVETLLAEARARNCPEVWVATEADNHAARALYAATGGAEEGGLHHVTWRLAPPPEPDTR